jgi:flagellar biosynthesis protein
MQEKRKREKAVGIRYEEHRDNAPRVIAKGEGSLAEKIKAVAVQHGVPVREDDDLVELLSQVDIDREIPPQLYTAVAELLSWIYRTNTDAFTSEETQ